MSTMFNQIGAKRKKYVNIGQYVFKSNLKCWILQNVMLYFVCEIMLKLCILNVKARLLYYESNLILAYPHVSEQGRMFLNIFYRII